MGGQMGRSGLRLWGYVLAAWVCVALLSTPAAAAVAGPAQGSSFFLTREEQMLLAGQPAIEVLIVSGNAPVAYFEGGQPRGILCRVLDNISQRTGAIFRYTQADSYARAQEAIRDGAAQVVGGVPVGQLEGLLQQYPCSQPLLTTESVLLMHTGVDAANLPGYVYAAVEGGRLPRSVGPVRYYKCRGSALDAIERGEADYCYVNEYSLAFYAQKNHYKNVVMVPSKQETLSYHLLYTNLDPRLVSVLDRAMGEISQQELQQMILLEAARVDREVTLSLLARNYGVEITVVAATLVVLLTLFIFLIHHSQAMYKRRNHQYRMLADLSDEYVYEYDAQKDLMLLSKETSGLLSLPTRVEDFTDRPLPAQLAALKEVVRTDNAGSEIALMLRDGTVGEFRIINSVLRSRDHQAQYIIGKLVDIRQEKKRMEALMTEAQMDGLTGLYNPDTTRRLVERACQGPTGTGILFVVDVDEFKSVNDTYGHLVGDKTLAGVAGFLKETFREMDVVGRLGGDEFCILMMGPVSEEVIRAKCRQLLCRTEPSGQEILTTLSIGVAVRPLPTTFEKLYDQADRALYQVKKNGRNGYSISQSAPAAQEEQPDNPLEEAMAVPL